jgi:hypothetical protein
MAKRGVGLDYQARGNVGPVNRTAIPKAFQDQDPERNALLQELVDRINALLSQSDQLRYREAHDYPYTDEDGEQTNVGDAIDKNTEHRETIGGNPHEVTLEEARSQLNILQGNVDYNDNSIENINSIVFKDGQAVTWNQEDRTLNVPTGLGPVNQVGQELFVIVYNDTGEDIEDLKVVHAVAGYNGRPSVAKAIADTHVGFTNRLWVTTMIIPDGDYGIATRLGRASGDTDMWLLSDTLYLSCTTAGEITATRPIFPCYAIQIAGVAKKDAVSGVLQVAIEGNKEDTVVDSYDGSFRESLEFLVTSNGVDTITGTLQRAGGGDLTMIFSDEWTMLDCTPAQTIELTAGTDEIHQKNYIYVPMSTKILTVSTSGWPLDEHIKVAYTVVQSAVSIPAQGVMVNQNWNDHIKLESDNGHLLHIAERLRQLGASWSDGTEGSLSTDGTDVYVANTSGHVYQLHKQTFPAHDTSVSDDFHVVNNFTTPFVTESNLRTQIDDALGASLNNTSFSFVMWGVQNKSGEESHLMINLPTGSYNKNFPNTAATDADNKSVYDIPADFKSTGFLIARFTMVLSGGTWTLYDTEDLRGYIPNVSAGGGGGGSGVTTFAGLSDTPSAYLGEALKYLRVNALENGIEFAAIVPVLPYHRLWGGF